VEDLGMLSLGADDSGKPAQISQRRFPFVSFPIRYTLFIRLSTLYILDYEQRK